MQPLADIRNLKVRFPDEGKDRMVINDISFQLHSGQITAMVGESGSGKSLTALALTGLLPSGALASGDLLLQESKDQYKNLYEAS